MRWLIDPIIFILPAWASNTTPIFVKKINFLNNPVDFGLSFKGQRIFGDNKTWRGLISGTLIGTIMALVLGESIYVGMILGFGALLGDLIGSFTKRRLGLAPSKPSLLLDQTPYVIVPILLYKIFYDLPLSMTQVIYLVVISMVIHRLSNIIYYKLGIKEVPH
jgi:CDP-2,3-bis-(O-geranylgeranyl)-sn-glycerol synthase